MSNIYKLEAEIEDLLTHTDPEADEDEVLDIVCTILAKLEGTHGFKVKKVELNKVENEQDIDIDTSGRGCDRYGS